MNNLDIPLYIVSKGRYDSMLTSKSLNWMNIKHYIVVEEQEYELYKQALNKFNIKTAELLILDKKYQEEYDTFDNLGNTKSKGPGAARNFAWEHSISQGKKWHWVMDDNIRYFYRLNKNKRLKVKNSCFFKIMEDFCLRYINISMAGPNYRMFCPSKQKCPPFTTNTRIYSCNLIRNDVPYRWRGRYNEDTDLSLRMLKDGWVTVQFNAFLQDKVGTQTVKGGNMDDFYSKEGTYPKSEMLVKMHPDVARLTYRFGRVHHYVNYSKFKKNKLIKKKGLETKKKINNYGLKIARK